MSALIFTLIFVFSHVKYDDHLGINALGHRGYKLPHNCLLHPGRNSGLHLWHWSLFLSFFSSLDCPMCPPSNALVPRSLKCVCVLGWVFLLDCSYTIYCNFKERDHSTLLPTSLLMPPSCTKACTVLKLESVNPLFFYELLHWSFIFM